MMVSNNSYRLDEHRGPCRPRLDEGLLGIIVLSEPTRPLREWTAPSFRIEASSAVPAGIDGEAAMLEAPLHFQTRPGALKVRIARSHPGAAPPRSRPSDDLSTARPPSSCTSQVHP